MLLFSGIVVILLATYSEPRGDFNHKYCVIGAGPSGKLMYAGCFKHHVILLTGLQIGYFLHTAGRDYLIIEKNNTAGKQYNLLLLQL